MSPSLGRLVGALLLRVILPRIYTSPVSGVTIHQSLFLNATVGVSKVQCTDSEDWIGAQGIDKNDCAQAIFDLQRRDAQPRRGQKCEFTSVGSGKHSEFPEVITPRKYDVDTCVVIIAMLERFDPGSLPGEAQRVYARTDTATFNGAWNTALEIQLKCLDKKRPDVGWSYTGASGSIAVLITARGSTTDRLVQGIGPIGMGTANGSDFTFIQLSQGANHSNTLSA